MNLSPFEIATYNLVAAKFGITDLDILTKIVANAPPASDFQALVQSMLVGPAGDLTVLTPSASDECCGHCRDGYIQAMRDVEEAEVQLVDRFSPDIERGIALGIQLLKATARQIAGEMEAEPTLDLFGVEASR